jgi:hypothetical protein
MMQNRNIFLASLCLIFLAFLIFYNQRTKTASVQELQTVTIGNVYWKGSPELNNIGSTIHISPSSDAVIAIEEWIPNQDYHQLDNFIKRAGHDFTLHADNRPDVRASWDGWSYSDVSKGANFRGYGLRIKPPDKALLVPGIAYTVVPINNGSIYKWESSPGDTVQVPAGV